MSDSVAVPTRPITAGSFIFASVAMALVVLGSVAGIAIVSDLGSSRLNAEGAVSFAMIIGVLWIAIYVEILRRPYSMHLVNLFAMYVLLGISPLYHVMIGEYPIALFSRVEPALVLRANAAILFWLTGYLAAYSAVSALTRRSLARRPDRWLTGTVSPARVGLELLLALGVLAYLAALGLGGVVTRGATHYALEDTTSTVYVINKVLARNYPVIATAAGLLLWRRVSALRIPATTLLILLVGTASLWLSNPLGAGRYWVATVALAFVAPHFLDKRRTGALTLLALTAGLTILPGLGTFEAREAESAQELAAAFSGLASPIQYLALSGDLGEYAFLTLTIRWIETKGYTWGFQLLGVLFSWIPRVLWPGKPVGTGTMVADDLGYPFTNFAAPIVSEPLVDFGYVGVFLLAAVLGAILARLDVIYWLRQEGDERRLRVIETFYPFFMGLQLLLVRGSLNYAFVTFASVFISTLPMTLSWRRRRTSGPVEAIAELPDSSVRNA